METWEIESKVCTALQRVIPPPGCAPSHLFVSESLRSDGICWGHCSKLACHPGVSRTMFLIKQRFWWQSMALDIRLFVLAYLVCATSKTSNLPPAGLLQALSVPSRPWSHISLDFVTGLLPFQGNTAVLTVVDRFSKATHFIPLPKLPSARETAVAVIDHVFRIHGLPTDVVSDWGPQFISKFWREFCRLLGASVSLSLGFHPQSIGQTERANQELEWVFGLSETRPLGVCNFHGLSTHIPLPVSATGLSLFECSLGYQPPIFQSLKTKVAVPSTPFCPKVLPHLEKGQRDSLQVRSRTKAQADCHWFEPPVYVLGQKVWLSSRNIPLRTVCNKLAPKFGPFTVTKIISPVAVRLKLPPAYRRVHSVFHVSKLKPIFHSTINPPAPVPPPPRLLDGEPTIQ